MRAVVASAPGRVNVIGEHTDYNDGFVLPVALPGRVTVQLRPRHDDRVTGSSADVEGDGWLVYAQAVQAAAGVGGFDVRVRSAVPPGAGLASSAALEVALLRALREAFALDLDDLALALLAHRAETEGVGVPCGVMDQIAASLGREGHALLLDCRSLEAEAIALPPGVELRVLDSGVRHAHAESGYRRRRAECEAAARALGVTALRDVEEGDPRIARLPPPLDRRARHVVEENARVVAAGNALRRGDVDALARLMRASHASQRDLFEVSMPEVDRLAEQAEAEGALAARLTGGGFGGAVLALWLT